MEMELEISRSLNLPVDFRFFDPVIPLIYKCIAAPAKGEYWFEIHIPIGLKLNIERIQVYFRKDAELYFQRSDIGYFTTLCGTIDNEELGKYLYLKAARS